MPAIIQRTQSPQMAQRVENTIAEINKQIDMIQRDISMRKITDVSSAKQAIALKQAKIKELRQYTTRTPVNVRDSKNKYRTFNVPYTATAKIKPRRRRPRRSRPVPKKSSIQSKMMAQKNRLQQARSVRAPRKSISKLPKAKSKRKIVIPRRRTRGRRMTKAQANFRRRMAMAKSRQRMKRRTRARRAMGPTRSKGSRRAKQIDKAIRARSIRKSRRKSRFRKNPRANRALRTVRKRTSMAKRSNTAKSLQAERMKLRRNLMRRKAEASKVKQQARAKARRARKAFAKTKVAKNLKKSKIAKRLTKVRFNKSKVKAKKKKAKRRLKKLRRRFRFGQANIGMIRRDARLGEEMRMLQYAISQAEHEDNQLGALFGRLAQEEANLVQQLYMDEENFGSTRPRHSRVARQPQASSGKLFYDAREFNTFAHRVAMDSGGVPTPAFKQLLTTFNNRISNGQYMDTNRAKKAFMQEVVSKRGVYFTRSITPQQQAQARQLGILTVQKNRMAKSTPDIRQVTASRRAFYEQQRVAEDARTKAATKSAEVEKQLAGFFPRTRSAMERMTR